MNRSLEKRSERRRRFHRRVLLPLGILVVLVLVVALAEGPSGHSTSSSPFQTTRPRTTTTAPPRTTTTTTDPGLLPQTSAEPPIDASLTARMTTLWTAIVTGNQALADTVFFPESAYVTLKTGQLPDPSLDFQDRLVAFYHLDFPVYRAALGPDPARAHLVAVNTSAADVNYIEPNTCENNFGYWHLPGVRLVYTANGTTNSFAVASLISWRGVWYVVHLGPNPRPVDTGTLDAPASGPGVPGPAGGC